MKRRKLHVVWLWGLLFLMTACGDDDYYYPSVKLEFVTVEAGEDGRIQTLMRRPAPRISSVVSSCYKVIKKRRNSDKYCLSRIKEGLLCLMRPVVSVVDEFRDRITDEHQLKMKYSMYFLILFCNFTMDIEFR